MRFILLMPKGDTAQSIGWCFCIPYSCVNCDSAPVLFERKVNLAEKRIRKMTKLTSRRRACKAAGPAPQRCRGKLHRQDFRPHRKAGETPENAQNGKRAGKRRSGTANRERNKRDEAEAHAYRAKHGRTQKDDENGKIGPKR